MKYLKLNILFFLFIPSIILAQTEKVDTTVMNQIRKEGLQNSKVMDIAFHLTDARGYFGKG
jgi:carboxypeptidase Q